jgi:polyisoprenoid-binding protein YceI
MKFKHYLLAAFSILLFSAFTVQSSIQWKIKEGYSIQFKGTDAEGVFSSLKGNIQFDPKQPESSNFNFSVAVNSINTGNGMKNKHAVSPKWFDAEQFPNITFQSTSVAAKGDGYEVTGNMQIHGVTKSMTIPFQFNDRVFTSSFSVNRIDFGVGTMEGMSKKVSNKIDLTVSIPVTE